ncbi:DUF4397 domain-containing protein [Catellatospora citrea]|uniref:DUF4397 domain-containing protein n=1 Tax=Catellatospora citrea TaxID=53366 RepID=UPI0033E008ED
MTTPNRTRSRAARAGALLSSLLLSLGLSAVGTAPAIAAAATVGYVRLAHLSPDTPAVDVYLTSLSGTVAPKVFKKVAYGAVSSYLTLPQGTYAAAMRPTGAGANTAPVLGGQVTVAGGRAYTVAGVGRYADLGLRVIDDNLSSPVDGKAKVRVIQASVRSPLLDVSAADGSRIADAVPFATTTEYQLMPPGDWKLRVRPTGDGRTTDLAVTTAAGGIYSIIILDGARGELTTELRMDAKGAAAPPVGGVDTGLGGTAGSWPYPLIVAVSLLVVVALSAVLLVRWRRRALTR